MSRNPGNRVLHILLAPVRAYRAAVEVLVAIRCFMDVRRRHLAVVVVVAMMVVVGIKLRYSGYADAHAVEYVANAIPDAATVENTKDAVAGSMETIRDGLASLSETANASKPETQVRERSNVAVSVVSAQQIDGAKPVRERTRRFARPLIHSPRSPSRGSCRDARER